MARTPLRTYLKEIEMMIERGQIDEAAAHCRHILESFPKLVAAYRLMGKAFLEGKRYADAADLFQRVLSTVPDDFVSHVGMSIIKEDEGNLDAGIWHMERAFEVQPYNAAIQGELKRLYGRRDGVEPPKVRLTRGALARMYARGNLYQQAITELRAGLAEDQQRPDLQVLLARMFFLSGARVEAVETCSQLISKLPYCLEANRILAAILPETGRKDDAQAYAQRVQSLDPYLAQASPAAPSGDGVPEASVILDRMEYTRGATGTPAPSQPAWAASLGVSVAPFTTKEEVLPDWLEDLGKETAEGEEAAAEEEEQPAEAPEAPALPEPTAPETPDWLASMAEAGDEKPAEEEAIPDWMKEAGWSSAPGAADKAPEELPELDAEEAVPAEGELAAAEIPDWLKALAPEEMEASATPEEEDAAAEALMPWLSGSATEKAAAPAMQEFEALVEDATPQAEETQPAAMEAIPDWLKDIGAAETIAEAPEGEVEAPAQDEAIEIPDWLKEPVETEETEVEEAKAVEIRTAPEVGEAEVSQPGPEAVEVPPVETAPEWVAQPEEAVLSNEDAAIAWLESLAVKQGASEEELTTKPEERPAAPPDWVRAEEPEAPIAAVEAEAPQAAVPSELPEWMKEEAAVELGAEEQAVPEEAEPATSVEIPEWLPEEGLPVEEVEPAMATEAVEAEPGELPDWLKALEAETAVEGVSPEPAAVEPETAPPFEAGDETAALAWLESLAAKQGAPEEELMTKPEERVETPPEWVTEAEAETPAPVEAEAPAETIPAEAQTEDATLAWLESLAARQGAPEEELTTKPEERPSVTPEWIQELAAEPVETAPVAETVEEAHQEAETPEAVESAAPAEAPASETEAPAAEPLPDWLETLAKEDEEEAIPEQAVEMEAAPAPEEEAELPEWMKEPVEEKEELPWQPGPVEIPAEPVRSLDINQASLVELEALSGVGFRMAQSILNYRQEHGPFTSTEDLLKVPYFSPELLQELGGKISVAKVEPASPFEVEDELRSIDADQEILIRARNAFMQEQIETMTEYYTRLIKQERLLDEVIHDLHEALYRFPVDVGIWETLGDAYARGDQLQEALDAYTKAEELLR